MTLTLTALILLAAPAAAFGAPSRGDRSPAAGHGHRAAKAAAVAPAKATATSSARHQAAARVASASVRAGRSSAHATSASHRTSGRRVAAYHRAQPRTASGIRSAVWTYPSASRGGGGRHTYRSSYGAFSAASAASYTGRGYARVPRGGTRSVSWFRDLPPAAGVQAVACPAGTMATLASGHSDVVRCMPL
jgi:hypothetical protein